MNIKILLKNLVKNNKIIYSIYYNVMSTFIKLISVFCKVKKNQILFVVYGGKKYDDSPRFIYEYIKSNEKYKEMVCKWAFIEPQNFEFIPNNEKVKIDTLTYYITALKSKYWITNSSVERGLNFKKKENKNIFFTHGMTAIKKIGKDIKNNSKTFKTKKKAQFDMIFIEGKKEKEILIKAWETDGDKFYLTGLPRNDELYNLENEKILRLRKELGIPEGKKVILYAPTFREFYLDKKLNNVINNQIDIEKWERELGNEYILLYTAHYQVGNITGIPKDSEFVINAFEYPYINDLLMVSDILISDYSSVIFDYSILERPIFCYGYDYEEYLEQRGMYTDLNKLFCDGVIKDNDELLKKIKNIDYQKESEFTRDRIKNVYIEGNGEATKKAIDIIFNK